MRTSINPAWAAFASILLAACGTTPAQRMAAAAKPIPAAASPQAVAQPAWRVGDSWSFQRVDLWRNEVVERFEQEMRAQDGERWTLQWRITDTQDPRRRGSITGEYLDARTHGFADARMRGRHVPLSFPLQVGKQWSFRYDYTPEHHRDVSVEQTASVVGWEEVSVPAGRFRALKVVHEGRYNAVEAGFAWNGAIREIYWYAPEVRRIVKREYRDTKGDGSTYDQWREDLVSMRAVPGIQAAGRK